MKKGTTIKQAVLSYGSVLLLSLASFSCFQEPTYPNAPQIKFRGFSRYSLEAGAGVGQSKRDSVVITIGFTDGDGDLGNDLPIRGIDSTRYRQAGNWGSYKIRTLRLENNQFRELNPGENRFLTFPRLSREGKTGAIDGNLEFEQLYPIGTRNKLYVTKYRIQIRDRALNVSNEIETDTITLPHSY